MLGETVLVQQGFYVCRHYRHLHFLRRHSLYVNIGGKDGGGTEVGTAKWGEGK